MSEDRISLAEQKVREAMFQSEIGDSFIHDIKSQQDQDLQKKRTFRAVEETPDRPFIGNHDHLKAFSAKPEARGSILEQYGINAVPLPGNVALPHELQEAQIVRRQQTTANRRNKKKNQLNYDSMNNLGAINLDAKFREV